MAGAVGKEGTGPIATALRCRLGQLHRLGRVDQCPEFQSEKPSENSRMTPEMIRNFVHYIPDLNC